MAIDVFFAGLMLLCFDGQEICRIDGYENTAWVVKADGVSKPCGRESLIKTQLELQFSSSLFDRSSIDPQWVDCDESDPEKPCVIRDDCAAAGCLPRNICVAMDKVPTRHLDASLQWLSVLGDVDRRLKAVDWDLLQNQRYVPIRLHFQAGILQAGEKWPPPGDTPRRWLRSNGEEDGRLPGELSDRLKVTYEEARVLRLTNCAGKDLIKLTLKPSATTGKVTLINRAVDKLEPEGSGGFDDLYYLAWYYRLGVWDTRDRQCPDFTAEKPPVLLRCAQEKGRHCSCYGNCEGGTIFWQGKRLPR